MVLRKKFDEFLESIEDNKVKNLVKKNTIITGGAIPSMLLKEKVNDFDLYFTNFETVEAVVRYYLTQFTKEPPKRYERKEKECGEVYYMVQPGRDKDEFKRIRIVIRSVGVAAEEGVTNYQYFELVENQDIITNYIGAIEKKLQEANDDTTKKRYRPIFLSDNAITLSQGIQIIIRFYGNPEEIHKNYDFTHCTSYWTSADNKLVLRPEALESLLTKQLKYVGSKYPLCSIIRMRKFIQRGWHISAGDILKIAFNLNHFDLTDVDVLQEQLIGVDVAYFNEIIGLLKQKMEKEGTKKIEETYLLSIIEKVFG